MPAAYPWSSWSSGSLGPFESVQPLVAEASSRQYYRLAYGSDASTAILMDASTLKQAAEKHCHLTSALSGSCIRVPKVLAHDLSKGWLLLEDFGDITLHDQATQGGQAQLLKQAVDVLLQWQQWGQHWQGRSSLPVFSSSVIERKLCLFRDYFMQGLGVQLDANVYQAIHERVLAEMAKQPQVVLHRDYHSRNLMYLPSTDLGVIDFQDAHVGALPYDLVSLLKDAYIDWPEEQHELLKRYYYERSPLVTGSYDAFTESFDWLGVGRHLKCLGLFIALADQEGKHQYKDYVPRLLHYLLPMADRYAELKPLKSVFQDVLDKRECD